MSDGAFLPVELLRVDREIDQQSTQWMEYLLYR